MSQQSIMARSSSFVTAPSAAAEREREVWYARDMAIFRLSLRDPPGSVAEARRWLSEVTPGSEAEAWAQRAYSYALRAIGEYQRSLACAQYAERRFGDLGLATEVARSASGQVWTLRYLGRYEEAVRLARPALRFLRARGETLEVARLTINLGTVYRPMGRLQAARRCYTLAARDYRRCDESVGEATALSNLGNVLADLGRYGEAEWAQRRAIRLYERLDQQAQLARAWLNFGVLLRRRGDYGRAVSVLNESRELASRTGATRGVPLAELELAQTLLHLNLVDEASAAMAEARAGFERLDMPHELGRALLWSAVIAGRQGQSHEATSWLAKATALFERQENRFWEAVTTVQRAGLREASASAVAEVAAAERRLARLGARDRALEARLVRADLLRRLGDECQALEHCRKAARSIRQLGSTSLAYRSNAMLGRLLERTSPGRALAHYRAAIDLLETLRRQARADDLKLSVVADKVDVYERATDLLLARGNGRRQAADALAMVERGKSPGLLEELLARAGGGGRIPAAAGRRLRDLRSRLAEAYDRDDRAGQPRDEDHANSLAELEQAVTSATRELQLMLGKDPAIAPFDLDRLQAALPADGVLLEYYGVGTELVCFVVDSAARGGGLRLRRDLGTLADAERLAGRLRFQVGKAAYGAEFLEQHHARLRPAFDRVLGELWQQLLEPLADDLRAVAHVVVVAHGPLHGMPLHAAFDGKRYLGDRLTISYAPSARVFTACVERRRGQPDRPLFVAPTNEQLPWVAREAAELARLHPAAKMLLGARATRANLHRRIGRFDLLHLATHGKFRADNPSFSSVHLSDGPLSVADLAELCRGAELVTLSACETGLNRLEAGEEVLGLTRAVLGAGASSLLASLWTVHDGATYRFMAEFYRHVFGGRSKAASVQAAMAAVRRELDHPYFWAPFALSGAV